MNKIPKQIFIIDDQSGSQRFHDFLIKKLKHTPKSKIYKIIRPGKLMVHESRCKPSLENHSKIMRKKQSL